VAMAITIWKRLVYQQWIIQATIQLSQTKSWINPTINKDWIQRNRVEFSIFNTWVFTMSITFQKYGKNNAHGKLDNEMEHQIIYLPPSLPVRSSRTCVSLSERWNGKEQ
jgi:hypothetical protein